MKESCGVLCKSILNWISLVVLVAWGLFLLQGFIWYYMPVNVIDYYNLPAKVINTDKEVRRGENLDFELEYHKHIDLPAKISRSLVNDRIVTLTCETGALQPTKRKVKTIVSIFIPPNVFPGKYKLITEITYRINPLRDGHERYETEWFTVLP